MTAWLRTLWGAERDPTRVRLRDFPRLVALHRAAAGRRQLMQQPDLTYLFWEATLRCNLRCRHCGSSCEVTSPVPELSTEQILGILDTIGEDFDARRIFVSITGGEPLLRPDLPEVVAHLTRLGMTSCIVSNGVLLTAERAARLVAAGMRTVSISIDGNEQQHERVRGPGSYRKAMSAITVAREAGFRDVEAITCVRPDNLTDLPRVEALVRAAGANLWRLITVDCMGRLAGTQDAAMWLEPPEVRRLLDYIAARRRHLAEDEDFGVQFSCGGLLGIRDGDVRQPHGQCYAGLCVGSILCDGGVSACPSLPRSWIQGSALERRFSSIWLSEFEEHRTTEWRRSGVCQGCDWFDLCLGGGLHERLAQPESFCWLDRQG